MLAVVQTFLHLLEQVLALPVRIGRLLLVGVILNPRLGPLRYLATGIVGYVAFALVLVYVVAPLRGVVGHYYMADKLRYDAERWLATAVYDVTGSFVGTFDPRLDSRRDFNYTDAPIELGSYVANPDHKSIPVREVPDHYWRCLVYHEDRHLGGPLNPAGIDLLGVLKIPYSTIKRSIALKRPAFGVGGSTLPMQFARVIYNTPPRRSEGGLAKVRRKLREWWLAPVIYHGLTLGGDHTPLKKWAANHIWLAQRTGGAPLHGVEVTSRIVFGKEAKDLSVAEQYVLASAVNKPIILLKGSDRLNEVRADRWRYIAQVRARKCATELIEDPKEQQDVIQALNGLAGGPPDPQVRPRLQRALASHAPGLARRAQANPFIRANALMPAARYGLREQMKNAYGFGWREYVRGVTTTLDVAENLAMRKSIEAELANLDDKYQARLDPGFTLDPAKARASAGARRAPNVIVVAATPGGEIVRFYEAGETAPYFGSPFARDRASGFYVEGRESRMIASVGKILAAIAIANVRRDGPNTLYVDRQAPSRGLEGCRRGGNLRRGRKAIVSFACSLNRPIEWRLAKLGQARVARLIEKFGFNMPPAATPDLATPPSTAVVRGLIAGSPRRVHQMAGVVLASLMGRGGRAVPLPSLVKGYDYTAPELAKSAARRTTSLIVPKSVISPAARPLLRTLLEAPLCYQHKGVRHGTLKGLSNWCAKRRPDLRLHFAKTGTAVTEDPDATVDNWIAGGLQFANGAAYSYVVVVGTGSPSEPWARKLHSSQVAAPLLKLLLNDLAAHARSHPVPSALPRPAIARAKRPGRRTRAAIRTGSIGSKRSRPGKSASGQTASGQTASGQTASGKDWRNEILNAN